MKIIVMGLATLASSLAVANDGGIAAIKVSEIKMREYEINQNGEEVERQRLTKPNFKIFINGEEARKLQMILPSTSSVITAMHPEILADYNSTFKALGVYNEAKTGVSSKVLTISCDDGEMVTDAAGKTTIKRKARSECTIEIRATADPTDYFGDKQDFNPICKP